VVVAALPERLGATGVIDVGADSTLNTYSSELAAGTVPNLSKAEIAELKEPVPDYTNREAVAEAATDANKDLAQASLLKNPADFLKDHFLEDPAEKALEGTLGQGGNGNGNGG
jgi:hypothetical protein